MHSVNFMEISPSAFMFLVSKWEMWPDGGTGAKVKVPSDCKGGMKGREFWVVLVDRSGVDRTGQVDDKLM